MKKNDLLSSKYATPSPLDWVFIAKELLMEAGRCVLVFVYSHAGSTPRETGAWVIVSERQTFGTLGGGEIERTVIGKVLSNKMDKTITVLVERKVKHPLYGKYINQSNKFHAHDEKNEINEGDVVQITEHKPISKSKSWVVTKVLSKGQQG